MATARISTSFPQPQVFPFVLPDSEFISQTVLTRFVALRRQIATLQQELDAQESQLQMAIESGAQVELGIFRAYLKTTERRNVSWRGVVERELGEAYAARVLAATKPDPSTSLIVSA
jgi:hypothetical protein